MKRIIFFLFFGMLVLNAQAKIWRVNNNPIINADFRSIQEANDASVVINGDYIYVEPSGISYGDLSISKKLVIIGNGYFLTENVNNHVNVAPSTIGTVSFLAGSSGAQLVGLTINKGIYFSDPINLDNIIIERNYISNSITTIITFISSNKISNLIIRNNYINGSVYSEGLSQSQLVNLLICNNYIQGSLALGPIDCSNSGIISNNVCGGRVDACGMLIENNICTSTYYFSIRGTGSTIKNNIIVSATNGTSTQEGIFVNNKFNVPLADIFVGKTGNSTDGQWQLKSGSPAIGAGVNGVDCGMFGNTDPYVLSGLAPIPIVYELIAPISASAPTGLAVKVKAKTQK